MDAALEMCKKLGEKGSLLVLIKEISQKVKEISKKQFFFLTLKGELDEDLTILSKEDWLKPHCGLVEDARNEITKRKIGSVKNKRDYDIKVHAASYLFILFNGIFLIVFFFGWGND
jgi:hypothetical protein